VGIDKARRQQARLRLVVLLTFESEVYFDLPYNL
jgi:hypothetical protein